MRIGYLMQEGGPDVRQKPLNGPANHVWQTVRELQNLGHRVDLLVRYDDQLWVSEDLDAFEALHVLEKGVFRSIEKGIRRVQSVLELPYLNLFESIRFSKACLWKMAGYDLFFERMGWMGYGAGLAARQVGVPLVMEANNGDHVTELKMLGVVPKGLQLWLSLFLMRRAVGRADHIVATGTGHRSRFIEFWKVPADKVEVVENGSELVDILTREQLRCFLPHQSAETVNLVFVGAFEPWHGIDVLLNSMARVVEKGVPLHLTLIGSGSQIQNVRTLLRQLNLTARVTLAGQLTIQELIPFLLEADLGLSPYCGWMEFSGLKLFDYKAAGLAVIASGEGGQPSTIEHGQTGMIVPPCDELALADAIISLAKDLELRRRLGRAARIDAEKRHSWKHTAQELELVFRKVAGRFKES